MKEKESDKPRDCTECIYYHTCNNAMYGSYNCKQKEKINSDVR